MKKRNRNKNDSLSDYNSKEDNHTSQTDIKVNKGKNYNIINSIHNDRKNSKICELKIPLDQGDKIKVKIGYKFYSASDKRVPRKELLECYESIIRKYFKDKTLIFG